MSDASDSPAAAASPTPSDGTAPATPARNASESPVPSARSNSPPVRTPAGSDDEIIPAKADDDDDAGLFGEGSEGSDVDEPKRKRALDDEELDSGDDDDRLDRLDEDEEMQEQKELTSADVDLSRLPPAHGTDGELYLLRYSQSVSVQAPKFNRKTFKPPKVGHHGAAPMAGFSSAKTAQTAIRWRRSRDDPATIQSNARIVRWSDGSLTLQIASNATEQLELPPKVLAPPQIDRPKPTPTSLSGARANGFKYEPKLDSHTYLASIQQEAGFVQLTNHLTTSLVVQANTEENDDALVRLQEQMAAMSKGYAKADQAAGPGIITVMEDPELAKRKAEIAERDRLRAQKRRETQEQKMRDRQAGVLGRAGLGRTPFASGLSLNELEGVPRAKKARKPRRRGSEYSDDEDDYGPGRTREDEYDEDDGFVAGSDEEMEYMDEDEAEALDRGAEANAKEESEAEGRSPKRARDEDDTDAGAGAGPKRGRRQVVDDDEED